MQLTNKIILGTVQFGLPYGINNSSGMPQEEQAHAILDEAWAGNIRMLDTAEAYGTAETVIGHYHEHHSNRFNVISKFKFQQGVQIRTLLENKLASLKVPSLYSYMFHSYSDFILHPELLQELTVLKSSGLIQKSGVSVYTNSELQEVIRSGQIDLIQLPYNMLDNFSIRGDLLKEAKDAGIEIHVRSVFLQGLFFKAPETIQDKLKPLQKYLQEIRTISTEHDIPLHKLALQYALSNPYIDKILIGVDSLEQLRANLTIIQHIKTDPGINERINDIEVKEVNLLNPANW